MTARFGWVARALICVALLISWAASAQDAVSVIDTAPIGTRHNYFLAPFRNGSFRHMDRIFPFHVVHRAGAISELPRADRQLGDVTYQWMGAPHTLDELHRLTKTTG